MLYSRLILFVITALIVISGNAATGAPVQDLRQAANERLQQDAVVYAQAAKRSSQTKDEHGRTITTRVRIDLNRVFNAEKKQGGDGDTAKAVVELTCQRDLCPDDFQAACDRKKGGLSTNADGSITCSVIVSEVEYTGNLNIRVNAKDYAELKATKEFAAQLPGVKWEVSCSASGSDWCNTGFQVACEDLGGVLRSEPDGSVTCIVDEESKGTPKIDVSSFGSRNGGTHAMCCGECDRGGITCQNCAFMTPATQGCAGVIKACSTSEAEKIEPDGEGSCVNKPDEDREGPRRNP